MFGYLTYILLDVIFNTAYWAVYKTGSGLYYIIYGNGYKKTITQEEYEMIVFSKDKQYSKLLDQLKEKDNEIDKLKSNNIPPN